MRYLVAVLLVVACAHRVCGRLNAAQIEAFHHSHAESGSANQSALAALTYEKWEVCIEHGNAEIQNHCAEGDDLIGSFDGGCPAGDR